MLWLPSILSLLQRVGADEQKAAEAVVEGKINTEAPGVRIVGAWCGLSSMSKPDASVDFAKKVKLDRLDVIVNDHAAAREPTPFNTYNSGKIIHLCNKARAAGIEVHLMSWIMPHEAYITEAAKQLLPLAQECHASSIQFDAEEPWTQAKKPMPYEDAAALIQEKFRDAIIGVNGIGYTPENKFGPLAAVCDYLVPQCYSTSTSGVKPETVVPLFVRRWKKVFADKPLVVGLAAYRQNGIANHTVESAMKTALAGAQALENIHTVVYWSLGHIQSSPRVQNVIKSISRDYSAPSV